MLLGRRWEHGSGTVRLVVEDDRYFPSLKDHMPETGLWKSFATWKTEAAVYLLACRRLTEAVVDKCERETGPKILISQEWPQEGVFWWFPAQVYYHITSCAQGGTGLKGIKYEHEECQSRLPAQGRLYVLLFGADSIVCHRNRSVLRRWQGMHECLLAGNDFTDDAGSLVECYGELEESSKSIKETLRTEIMRDTFDRGRCELCP